MTHTPLSAAQNEDRGDGDNANSAAVPPAASGPKVDPATFPDPPRSAGEALAGTIDNLRHLLGLYGIVVRFNVLKKRLDIDIPGLETTEQNRDQVVLHHIENLAIKHRMSAGRVASNLLAIGDIMPYDPFANWIDSKGWDGTDRLSQFYDTVTPQPDYPIGFRNTLIHKWLISIVAATFVTKGFRARGALTFQGAQGVGKTSWFKRLVSDPALRDQAVKLGHSWDGGSKDAKLAAIRHRVVEWGELEGSFRREIAGLKAFFTEDYDKIRPPYARAEAEYPRQTVFGASVNESDYLLDATGNSRFWTIAVDKLDYQHDIDMQQVFAQLKVDFRAGKPWWLSNEEETTLEAINRNHRFRSVVADLILDRLDLSLKETDGLSRDSAREVLAKVGIDKPTDKQFKEAAAILRELLGPSKKIQGTYRWYVPWSAASARNSISKPAIIDNKEY